MNVAEEIKELNLDLDQVLWMDLQLGEEFNHYYKRGVNELAISSLANYNYDDGYGTQQLFGVIVLKDGSWYSRWEYDGSEGWEHNKTPSRPSL